MKDKYYLYFMMKKNAEMGRGIFDGMFIVIFLTIIFNIKDA
jgi:hypothetical protein